MTKRSGGVRVKHVVELRQGADSPGMTFEVEGFIGRLVTRCPGCSVEAKIEFSLDPNDTNPVTEFFATCLDVLNAEGGGK